MVGRLLFFSRLVVFEAFDSQATAEAVDNSLLSWGQERVRTFNEVRGWLKFPKAAYITWLQLFCYPPRVIEQATKVYDKTKLPFKTDIVPSVVVQLISRVKMEGKK
jgi:hypothetical protein